MSFLYALKFDARLKSSGNKFQNLRKSLLLQTGLSAYHYQQIVMIDYEFEMSLQTFRRCIQVPSHIMMNLLYRTRFGNDSHYNALEIFSEGHLKLF